MTELLDVLDESGNLTGETKTKNEIMQAGDWRRVIHVWVVDDNRQLLIQQRASGRGIFDGQWDVSVGGGVRAGEANVRAAQRETGEELGLRLPEGSFVLLGTWKIPPKTVDATRIMKDFSDTFLVRVPKIELSKIAMEPDEVQAVDTIALKELAKNIQEKAFYADWVQHGQAYYQEVIAKILTEETWTL